MQSSSPPDGLNIYEDHRAKVIASVVAPAILAIIAVALRLCARTVSKATLGWDDYLIILALVLNTGNCVLNVLMAKLGGMGLHVWNPEVNLEMMFKLVFAMEFIYSSTIPAIKISVLMFYRRIFPIRRFSYALYGCAFLALGWFIGVMVVNFVQCFPYAYFWKQYGDPNAKGKCIAVEDYFMGNGIAEAITDFIILVTPFYQVWKLQMPTSQKIAVSAIFGLGFFTCVAGALRCYAVYLMNENEDITWNFGRGFIWSSIEPSCGIISACLPTLRPLLRHFFPTAFGNSSHQKSSEFHPLSDRTNFGPGEGLAPQNDIRGGSSDSSAPLGSKQDPHHAIMVRQEFMFSTKSDEHEHA